MARMSFFGLSLGLLLALDSAATPPLGDLAIPTSRVPDWSIAGVQGDIPDTTNTTNWPKVDATTETASGCSHVVVGGTGDPSAANNSALQCIINYYTAHKQGASGTVVYLPAGTYYFGNNPNGGGIAIKSNVDLMCHSPSDTVLNVNGAIGNLGWANVGSPAGGQGASFPVTSSIPRGTTVFTVTGTPGWSAGQWVQLREDCDATKFTGTNVCSQSTVYLGMFARVVSSSGSTVTLDRPTRDSYTSTNPKLYTHTLTTNAGLQNCDLRRVSGTTNTYMLAFFTWAANSWILDNKLELIASDPSHYNHPAGFSFAANDTFRGNGMDGTGTHPTGNNAGVVLENSNDNLLENNWSTKIDEGYLPFTADSGNVYAYNYRASNTGNADRMFTNHGQYCYEELEEGNTGVGEISLDAQPWGITGPRMTLFRNELPQMGHLIGDGLTVNFCPVGGALTPTGCSLLTSSKFANVIGNVFHVMDCSPPGQFRAPTMCAANMWLERNRHTSEFFATDSGGGLNGASYVPFATGSATGTGTGVCSTNDPHCGGSFGPWLSDAQQSPYPGGSNGECPALGAGPGCLATGYSGAAPIFTSGAMPASLYRGSKPSWWCNETPWPAVGADVTNVNALNKIPAQRRYEGLSCTTAGVSVVLGAPGQPQLKP
jgi:hypothetical protein